MLRNLASSLFLTERDAELDDNEPKVKGRVITTLQKAKEVRPLVERCITIACRSIPHQEQASQHSTDADRGSDAWRQWRKSDQWQQWNAAIAPVVAARRRAVQLLGDKDAVRILFDEVAPRFEDRPGGYTRILRLAKPRLGDAGTRAILEFVGKNDRVRQRAEAPAFDRDTTEQDTVEEDTVEEVTADATATDDADSAEDPATEDQATDTESPEEEKDK
jgi:large subunit ribosomal protein L17